jgi:ABC-type transport system involved in cytochrome c biogenesis permease component
MFIAGIFDTPEGAPDSLYQPALLPLALLFFGAIIFAGGMLQDQRNMKRTPTRWVGFAIILLATLLGFTKTFHMMDPMYQLLMSEYPKRWIYMHYIAFGMPVIGILVALGWNWWEKKQKEFIS